MITVSMAMLILIEKVTDQACLMTESSPISKFISQHCLIASGVGYCRVESCSNTTQRYYEAFVVSQRT